MGSTCVWYVCQRARIGACMQIRAQSGQLRAGVVRRQAVELYRGSSNDRDNGRDGADEKGEK